MNIKAFLFYLFFDCFSSSARLQLVYIQSVSAFPGAAFSTWAGCNTGTIVFHKGLKQDYLTACSTFVGVFHIHGSS